MADAIVVETREMEMFKIWFTNFGYYSADRFETIEQAIAGAKSKGFEATILQNDFIVASWSPIGGTKIDREFLKQTQS